MRLFFLMLICFWGQYVVAQEKHFMFIQSDNQSFYVILNGKTYSSSATGYLIVPKLADGPYNFSIGFAQNAFPEQNFSYTIDKKDVGFSLRNFNEKGWGLFDMQSLSVTMASGTNATPAVAAQPNNDPAQISFDRPATAKVVAKTPDVALPSSPKPDSVKPTVPDNVATTPAPAKVKTSVVEKQTATVTSSPAASATANVQKLSEIQSDTGLHLTYLDVGDTVHIIIPTEPGKPVAEVATTAPAGNEKATSDNKLAIEKAPEPNFIELPATKAPADTVTATPSTAPAARSTCSNPFSDEDYLKTRRKMALQSSDERMIKEATKAFKNKCLTTDQVKRLSTIFLSDDGRYNFFAACRPFVADLINYRALQSQFVDPAIAQKFLSSLQ